MSWASIGDSQRAELEKDPLAVGRKGLLNISDQQIRDSLEGAQLSMQADRGTDLTIFSPRASWMGHHIGKRAHVPGTGPNTVTS